MTVKLGQDKVFSVLYRSIDKSPRLNIGLFKYDLGKATSPPLSERDGGQTADSNCAVYTGTGEKYQLCKIIIPSNIPS